MPVLFCESAEPLPPTTRVYDPRTDPQAWPPHSYAIAMQDKGAPRRQGSRRTAAWDYCRTVVRLCGRAVVQQAAAPDAWLRQAGSCVAPCNVARHQILSLLPPCVPAACFQVLRSVSSCTKNVAVLPSSVIAASSPSSSVERNVLVTSPKLRPQSALSHSRRGVIHVSRPAGPGHDRRGHRKTGQGKGVVMKGQLNYGGSMWAFAQLAERHVGPFLLDHEQLFHLCLQLFSGPALFFHYCHAPWTRRPLLWCVPRVPGIGLLGPPSAEQLLATPCTMSSDMRVRLECGGRRTERSHPR